MAIEQGDSEQRGNRIKLRKGVKQQALAAQKNEITEYHIYQQLAKQDRDQDHRDILNQIAEDEKRHAEFWQSHTEIKVKPDRLKIFFYTLIARVLGLTFGVKLMEKGEELAQVNYDEIAQEIPEVIKIKQDEQEHEVRLIKLINEEGLRYVGSMVLGVNDALVELTGALAGLTLALQNARLVALTGLITGIAASFSMAASEYLSTKAELTNDKSPLRASVYTGIMYILTVALLITPYFLFANPFIALLAALVIAILIIMVFTFYISVAQDLPFRKRFFEMAAISLGIATLTFGIGYLVKALLDVEI